MTDEPQNGWHRDEAAGIEETFNAGDDAQHEMTVYYQGDEGRFAEETFYLEMNPAGRWSVCQMSHIGQWAPDDPNHEDDPVIEDYVYDDLGLYDYPDTPEGVAQAIKERDRFMTADESDSYGI